VKPKNQFIDSFIDQLINQGFFKYRFTCDENVYFGEKNLGKMFFATEFLYDLAPWYLDAFHRKELQFDIDLTSLGYYFDKKIHMSIGADLSIYVMN